MHHDAKVFICKLAPDLTYLNMKNAFLYFLATALTLTVASFSSSAQDYNRAADSLAFVNAQWEVTELERGAQAMYAQIPMFNSVQSISVVKYPAKNFRTEILHRPGETACTPSVAGKELGAAAVMNGGYFHVKERIPSVFFKNGKEILGYTHPTELYRVDGIFGFRDKKGRKMEIIHCHDTLEYASATKKMKSAMATGPLLILDDEIVVPMIRLTAEKALRENFCSKEVMALLINCVQSHMNLTFCGMPGIGKTECVKFFSQFIPANERVITIEDTLEIRYGKTNPGKDCIEMKVSEDTFGYADAIKSSLRLNPKWIMLSEARSKEVKYLLESWSTGVRGMTTLHTDDVRNVPDRILNMLESRTDADRMENDIFQALDVGVLVRNRKREDNTAWRYIDQMCFYLREKSENKIIMVVFDGNYILNEFPQAILNLFLRAGIENPLISIALEEQLMGTEYAYKEEIM